MASGYQISKGVDGPARELRIPRAIGDLKQAIEELGKSFEVLEKRLAQVAGPEPPEVDKSTVDRFEGHRANGANTEIQSAIDSARSEVASLNRRAQSILNRLEI